MQQQMLPGTQPERSLSFTIVFDGGSRGNPGHGYGSFHISGPNGEIAHDQLDFAHLGNRVTNNQAEYRSLIGAFVKLETILGEQARAARVRVLGDSLLVINQLKGSWKVKNADLRPLYEEARSHLGRFAVVTLEWHDRSNSVRILGH